MDTDLLFALERLGLTRVQAQVFLSLLHNGQVSMGKIVTETQLHRGTVYNTLRYLIQKGLVGLVQTGSKIEYVSSPGVFFSDLQKQEEQLEEKRAIVKKVIEWQKLATLVPDTSVVVQVGTDSYRLLFEKAISTSARQDTLFFHTSRGGLMFDHIGPSFYSFTQRLKNSLGVKSNALLSGTQKKHSFASHMRNVRVKWIKNDSLASSCVFDDHVLLTDWSARPIVNVLIHNKSIARFHQDQFKRAWKNTGVKAEEYGGQ